MIPRPPSLPRVVAMPAPRSAAEARRLADELNADASKRRAARNAGSALEADALKITITIEETSDAPDPAPGDPAALDVAALDVAAVYARRRAAAAPAPSLAQEPPRSSRQRSEPPPTLASIAASVYSGGRHDDGAVPIQTSARGGAR